MKANTALASLSQQPPCDAVAACTLTLTPLDATAPTERVHLLPDGSFKAKDGRPTDVAGGHWLLDDTAMAALTSAAGGRQNDYVFDYEHQTLHKEANGQPAPAAGWFSGLSYVPGEGLFATGVRWTERAAAHIRAGEYRYTSCVFRYDRTTGRVQQVLHAALTNDPGLDGLRAIAALTASTRPADHHPGETAVNEALKRLLASLGINVEGVDFADAAALTAAVAQAETAIAALTAKSGEVAALTNQLNTLQTATPDPTKFVPITVANDLRTQLAALSVQHQSASVDKVIQDARAAGKLLASEEDWARSLVKHQGLAALTANLADRPAIAALTAAPQSQQRKDEGESGTAALTAEEKAVCAATGLSHEAYLAAKKEA